MARIMAFDYGLKRIGIAVTDPLQLIASPLQTVENQAIWQFLQQYLQKEAVEAFVVGYPIRADGSNTHATKPIEKFIEQLRMHYPHIAVHIVDEYGSSRDALRAMIAGGTRQKYRRQKGNIDRTAATLLLQEYLQSR